MSAYDYMPGAGGAGLMYPNKDLGFLVERAMRTFPSDVAVVDGDRSFTFGQLDDRTARLANFLLSVAPEQNSRVAVLMTNQAEFVEADLAILRAGLAKVPINPRLSFDERRYVLENSGAAVVIVDARTAESAKQIQSEVSTLDLVLEVGDEGPLGYEAVLASASRTLSRPSSGPDGPSVILYTSGTTGRPKGAVASFASRYAAVVNMLASEIVARRGEGILHAGPLSHGSGSKVIPFILKGARNIVAPKFEPDQFLRMAEEVGATTTFVVPTMIAMLTEAVRSGSPRPPLLDRITYGGSPIAERTIVDAMDTFGPVFTQVYGSCEAPHPVTILTARDHVDGLEDRSILGSAGREAVGMSVRVVAADGSEVPEGETGEVVIGGDSLMVGYWNNPEATHDAVKDGWYWSGDLGWRDDRGLVHLVDRKSGLIISGGLNIYPGEIERVLMGHSDILEAAVVGVPDEKWGEAVHAFVVPRDGKVFDENEIIAHCESLLAGYKKPRYVTVMESLPKGSTGKIAKDVLVARHRA